MDRKIVVMLTVSADDDLPNIVQLDRPNSDAITPLVRALIRHDKQLEEREELEANRPGWRDFDVDGHKFSLRPDGNGGLEVGRNFD